MYVHSDRSRKVLHGIREFDDFVTVRASDEGVDPPEEDLLFVTIFLSARVLEVVGVDDSDDVSKLVRPSFAVVEPRQMFWLLEHGHVRFLVGDVVGDITHRDDAPFVGCVSSWIKVNLKLRVKVDPSCKPTSDVLLLLFGGLEHRVWMHQLLITRCQPRNQQSHPAFISPVCHVRRTEKGVDGGSGHPRKARCRHDGEVPIGVSERYWRGARRTRAASGTTTSSHWPGDSTGM